MSVIHNTRTSVSRYEAFQAFTHKMRHTGRCLVSIVKEKIENLKNTDRIPLSNRKRSFPLDLEKVEYQLKSELMNAIPPPPVGAVVEEEIDVDTDPFFSDEEITDEEEFEMQTLAYEVDHIVQYTQLLHQVEENKGKIIKTKGSDILIQKPHRLFSTPNPEENIKGSSSKGFQKLLNEAEKRMKEEPLTALQMLRTMSFNRWVKKCFRHHPELKKQFEQLQKRALMRTLEESIYHFTKLIGSVYRQEIQDSLEIGDVKDPMAVLSEKCPHLSDYAKMFDTFRNMIVDKILSQSTAKQRRDVIETLIYVAHSALRINRDYTTAMLILNGLSAQSVAKGRLKETWQKLPESTINKFKELEMELQDGMRSTLYDQNVEDMLKAGARVHSVPFLVPFQAMLARTYGKMKQGQGPVKKLEAAVEEVEMLFSKKEKGELIDHLMQLRAQIVACKESESIECQKLKDQFKLAQKIEKAPAGAPIKEFKIWQELQKDLQSCKETLKKREENFQRFFEHLMEVTDRARRDFDQLFSSHEPAAPVLWFNQPSAFTDEEKAYQRSLEIEPFKTKQLHN